MSASASSLDNLPNQGCHLTLYLTVAVIHKKRWWLSDRAVYSRPAAWIVPLIVGVLLAVSFELWAVHAVHRWQYRSMPLVPVIHVGVTPVFQMILIPLAATALCCRLAIRQSQVRAGTPTLDQKVCGGR